MPEIKIVSMYNGRYHISTIKRAERVCQIAVDGKVVYDDESENEQGNPADGIKPEPKTVTPQESNQRQRLMGLGLSNLSRR